MEKIDFKVLCNEITARLEFLRNEMKRESKEAFTTMLDKFFQIHPEINTIFWAQWVPGFNDGDPCVFSLGDINFSSHNWKDIDGPHYGEEGEDDEGERTINFNYSDKESDLKNFVDIIQSLEEYFEDTFGSSAFVRIHRDGIEVEEYDCGY